MSHVLDAAAIQEILPHRYPFLLVDRVTEMEPGRRAVGWKCVTIDEPYFVGHFPGHPVMPGVLVIEALAQVGAVLLLSSIPERGDRLFYFTGIDDARFRRPIVPGDRVRLEVEVLKVRSRTSRLRGEARVDGELAAEARLLCAMVDRRKAP